MSQRYAHSATFRDGPCAFDCAPPMLVWAFAVGLTAAIAVLLPYSPRSAPMARADVSCGALAAYQVPGLKSNYMNRGVRSYDTGSANGMKIVDGSVVCERVSSVLRTSR
jgi:hypothetical protein